MCAKISGNLLVASFVAIILSGAGCTQKEKEEAKAKPGANENKKGVAKHNDWWCEEHGVPEHLCSLCINEVASKCKKEGDWCKIHDRAQSQCFKCDPSKFAQFEAMYVAKFGSPPPRPDESEFKK